jgi:hypothetical protein
LILGFFLFITVLVWVLDPGSPKGHGVSQEKVKRKGCEAFQKDGMFAPGGIFYFERHNYVAPFNQPRQVARIWYRKTNFLS